MASHTQAAILREQPKRGRGAGRDGESHGHHLDKPVDVDPLSTRKSLGTYIPTYLTSILQLDQHAAVSLPFADGLAGGHGLDLVSVGLFVLKRVPGRICEWFWPKRCRVDVVTEYPYIPGKCKQPTVRRREQ